MASPAAIPANDETLGVLPVWDLNDLYPGLDSAELKRDIADVGARAAKLEQQYKGRIAALSGDELAAAIAEYEKLEDLIGRMMSYASLAYAGDMADPKIAGFYQDMQEKLNDVTTRLLFLTLELNRLEEPALERKFSESAALAHYRPWLRDLRLFREHQLDDELERLLHEKAVTGRAAWNRLFDETMAGLRFPFGKEQLTAEQMLHKLSDKDPKTRRTAARSLAKVFRQNIRLFALITNTLAKDKEVEDRWRKYPTPEAYRHLSNCVEPEVVDALTDAVTSAYPKLSHRYYKLKARWMGVKKLPWWDRNAPLPEDTDRVIGWDEARDIVLKAYGRFSPQLADLGRKFFDNPWIDAPARPGKASGAFAHPTVPSAHPYLLLNYQGRTRDVMTLAHELGHGVHQLLAAEQGPLMADTPLTLAETASVFGEQLTFRALLDQAGPERRKLMLASKVEDMLNTVVRQIAFFKFERQVHAARREGELTPDRLGEIWLGVQKESLGPAIRFDEDYSTFWCYIPHFIHSPFYVYAYAFGDCLVNALYARYQDAEQGFQEKYFAMLRAGGTLRHKELLAPFGLDASDPAFWSKGLGVIEGFIDELEMLG
ncbi:MAG TPA: M3 family oligoendopeptidase [Ferrovibrio sp.]|jgi:oligoendopeptidase F|uniref:M3 family oligoendopeptidase n=1 Tax=Ferrovibrio sp. TaxID=1917215 RepID=UPI002B4B0038|nr:M3 family oligoendopeptidase [Ferrovibrio sp.]HLT77892.1 M3 family oligoendopeptidase [Ferrovibrio sp.]